MSLLDDVAEPVHGTELSILTTLLFNISLLGFHRTSSVLHQDILHLPGLANPDSAVCRTLQRLMETRHLQGQRLESGQNDNVFRNILATIRRGDEGIDLVGSRVQVPSGKVCRWGTINSYDAHTHLYHVDMQDRTQVIITYEQVKKYWRPTTSHSSWTQQDQTQLGAQIRKFVGCRAIVVDGNFETHTPPSFKVQHGWQRKRGTPARCLMLSQLSTKSSLPNGGAMRWTFA
jgi:hypothetical protein